MMSRTRIEAAGDWDGREEGLVDRFTGQDRQDLEMENVAGHTL